ncbi:MAG TPA: PEGA domain-containing protein [Candidatus Acidoferrales bacterium]|nr:PEGA domain-containing protein [Candidatus Acidoferrales bacterium]
MRSAIRLFTLSALAALFAIAAHAQAATEYGGLVGNSSTAATSAKIKVPNMKVPDPGNANSSSAPGQPKTASSAKPLSPDEAAAANRQYLLTQAGASAATLSLRSTPDHAQIFVDTRFVGAAPLDLKLAPGHHEVMIRAQGMETAHQSLDLTAKKSRPLAVTLKPGASEPALQISH